MPSNGYGYYNPTMNTPVNGASGGNYGWNVPQLPSTDVGFVQSRAEAESKQLAAGGFGVYFDIAKPLIYIKKIGNDSLPVPIRTVRYEDYVEPEPQPQPQVDMSQFATKEDMRNEFAAFRKQIEEMFK